MVGETDSTRDAIRLTQQLEPDVVLLDAAAPGLSASAATRRIKDVHPGVAVLVLSLIDDENLVALCLQAGASGCIRKDERIRQLAGAIHAACRKHVQAA